MTTDAIRPMRADDVAAAIAVSADADRRFLDVDDPRIAGGPDLPWTEDELLAYVDAERGWVATENDVVVGFAVVLLLDGVPHIEEISVARRAGRRGVGTRLLRTVQDWASGNGARAITLTTFRDVAWNRPWYERHGFRVLDEDEWTLELAAQRDHEAELGLPADLRVIMRLDLA